MDEKIYNEFILKIRDKFYNLINSTTSLRRVSHSASYEVVRHPSKQIILHILPLLNSVFEKARINLNTYPDSIQKTYDIIYHLAKNTKEQDFLRNFIRNAVEKETTTHSNNNNNSLLYTVILNNIYDIKHIISDDNNLLTIIPFIISYFVFNYEFSVFEDSNLFDVRRYIKKKSKL